MLSWLLLNIKEIGILTFGFFSFLILNANRNLKKKNDDLQNQVKDNFKLMDIQAKVIDVTHNTKPTDFDGIIDLMRKDKL